MIPDLAIISRSDAPLLTQELADYDNRFVAWCSEISKECFIAVHMPFSDTENELKIRCQDIKNMALNLNNKGYSTLSMAGDFNTPGTRIAKVCENILPIDNSSVEIHTSKGERGNSCGSNQGHVAQKNIDIMIRYNFKEEEKP